MSFFVSDTLKGRITEEELVEKSHSYTESKSGLDFFVRIENFKDYHHDFELLKFTKNKQSTVIEIEVPKTYKYISSLIGESVIITIRNEETQLMSFEIKIDNFSLIRQNERNCFLLKIFIDE